MAELVNQRIEDMINELEQMRRTELYDEEELREIARRRKEFEYKIQRREKSKEDFVHYIAYELAILEDISFRRSQARLGEKRNEIEYTIAKRLNKLFKQFIYRFQNDIEIYFQYIKFCKSVGFDSAISRIIGQMLQHYGDKPKMWQMACKWEVKEKENLENGREFLIKGLHRHPEAGFLYLDLFNTELLMAFKADSDEDKEKQIKRANVVWKNCAKNVPDVNILFRLYEISQKYELAESITQEIRKEIWSRNTDKNVWSYVASKELEGCHWKEIEEFLNDELEFPEELKYFISTFEEALKQFPDEKLCTNYIHELLGISETMYSKTQKVNAVKHAWMFGHEHGILSNDMYIFGIQVLKLENELTKEQIYQILDSATKKNPTAKYLWEEKLQLSVPDEKKMFSIVQEASKSLKADDTLCLWNIILDNIKTGASLQNLYKKFQNCESAVLMAIKPKLLQKMYEHNGLKGARDLYEELIRTPPLQLELHTTMIDIENMQDTKNVKQTRKCYECQLQHHGSDSVDIWLNYMKFESECGSAHLSPAIYRRAVKTLKKELVDQFIIAQTLSKIN